MTTACFKRMGSIPKDFENCTTLKSEAAPDILPLKITYLTPALIEEARTQLNETEDTRRECLAQLRKLIKHEPKLSSPTDDLFLLAFLRARKFNVKRAFKLFQNYWSFRKEHNHVYESGLLEPGKALILRSYLGYLEYRDRRGCAVYLTKFSQWDPDVDSYEYLFRVFSGMLEYSLEHEATQIAGFRVIFDVRGLQWKQLKHLTPSNIMLLTRSTQSCFPARYKAIHIISDSNMFDLVWKLVSPFLTSKVKKRIFFHMDDLSSLREYIHPSVLPQEFGGDAPHFNNDSWPPIIESRYYLMKEMLKYGYKD